MLGSVGLVISCLGFWKNRLPEDSGPGDTASKHSQERLESDNPSLEYFGTERRLSVDFVGWKYLKNGL